MKTSDEILADLIDLFLTYLNDLNVLDECAVNDFVIGEKTAYVECLEIIQNWEKSKEHGLDFDLSEKYPV